MFVVYTFGKRKKETWIELGLRFLEMGFRELLSIFDWDQESNPKFQDFLALTVFALFFPTIRYFLDRFVFEVKFVDLLNSLVIYGF